MELKNWLIEKIQDEFPLKERPYKALAEWYSKECGVSVFENDVFENVKMLFNEGVIRRIGGVIDSKKLGFISRLCAVKIPENQVSDFAKIIDDIPEATHHYLRSHEYNLWFTLIAENEAHLNKLVEFILLQSGADKIQVLPSTKMFKISTVFKKNKSAIVQKKMRVPEKLNALDKCILAFISRNLPLHLTPYQEVSKSINNALQKKSISSLITEEDLLKKLQLYLECGFLRRLGAILRHQKAGYTSNAMVVFNVNDESSGVLLAEESFVSHCYLRPPFENFNYNLYAMVHAENDLELQKNIAFLKSKIKVLDCCVLHSLKEFKKTSFHYFSEFE